jgi:hypothetical protein
MMQPLRRRALRRFFLNLVELEDLSGQEMRLSTCLAVSCLGNPNL